MLDLKSNRIARRAFLQANAVVTVGALGSFRAVLPRRVALRKMFPSQAPAMTLRDPRVKAMALQAVEAARTAGAQYADVRMTNTIELATGGLRVPQGERRVKNPPSQNVKAGMSVRALVNGYWGWAATPFLSPEEAVRIARLATQFAAVAAARGKPRTVDMGTIPVVQDGDWTTPVKIDPFTLDMLDVHEWLYGTGAELADLVSNRGKLGVCASQAWANNQNPNVLFLAFFQKQERVFASSEGTFLTQTVITTTPTLNIPYVPRSATAPPTTLVFYKEFSQPVQAGFEWYTEASLLELARREMDIADATPVWSPKPIDVGRYDCVFSAAWVAQILSVTLGTAAQLDRMLGYEANATGTSYLGSDPLAVLGTPVASPLVNITAERSASTGLATAKWDDEGVATRDFPLVKDGMLVNYPTTREQASWVARWEAKQGQPVHSLGCARAPDALHEPMQHTPNLVVHPGSGTATEESLEAELEHGLHFHTGVGSGFVTVDWQSRNLFLFPVTCVEVRRGKVVGFPSGNMALMINADQFWKNIQVIGGPASAEYIGWNPNKYFLSQKGDPVQPVAYSIGAVPIRVAQLPLVRPAAQ